MQAFWNHKASAEYEQHTQNQRNWSKNLRDCFHTHILNCQAAHLAVVSRLPQSLQRKENYSCNADRKSSTVDGDLGFRVSSSSSEFEGSWRYTSSVSTIGLGFIAALCFQEIVAFHIRYFWFV